MPSSDTEITDYIVNGRDTGYVSIPDCQVVHQSQRAILVVSESYEGEVWWPTVKNMVHPDSEVYDMGDGSEGMLIVKRFLAEDKDVL